MSPIAVLFLAVLVPVSVSPPDSPVMLNGGDISALEHLERHGAVFREGEEPTDAIAAMRRRGANCFRLRLFVDPTMNNVVVNDIEYTIRLAKRIRASGASLLLDFHYSDTWADPAHQVKPSAWKAKTSEELAKQVRVYTRDCLARMRAEGALPEYVQIGNEIGHGMLWPEGRPWGEDGAVGGWDGLADLLKAAALGVRDVASKSETKIVIHIHCGGDVRQTRRFFDNMVARNVPFDVIGLSYYPWWHGTLDDLRNNLKATAERYQRPVWVVETAYPHRELYADKQSDKVRAMTWPQTVEGQKAFLEDVVRTVTETPSGRGLGVLWWYPESIPTDGVKIWNGGRTALFDEQGRPLPAMDALGRDRE